MRYGIDSPLQFIGITCSSLIELTTWRILWKSAVQYYFWRWPIGYGRQLKSDRRAHRVICGGGISAENLGRAAADAAVESSARHAGLPQLLLKSHAAIMPEEIRARRLWHENRSPSWPGVGGEPSATAWRLTTAGRAASGEGAGSRTKEGAIIAIFFTALWAES